jgi:hypothetical protein
MRSPVAGGHEPISPELVLVDPALRRLLLQYPDVEIPRWEVRATPRVAAPPPSRRPSWRSHVLVAAAAAAVTAAIVIVPGGASPTPSAPRTSAAAQATVAPRTFAWVATPGATGYKFALYLGSKVVYEATTSKQQLTLPASWRHQGTSRTLVPGHYRWYVWALDRPGARTEGKRALVQATLEVAPH